MVWQRYQKLIIIKPCNIKIKTYDVLFDQNNTNNVAIDGFESSEVVTNDLKRLFAAMDE